jgi:hypothetical protein
MMTARTWLLLALGSSLACTQPTGSGGESPPPASVTPQAAAPAADPLEGSRARGVVIATVETNDARVSILGGGKELRVIVRKGGVIVADGLTLAELREKDPALHQVVTSAYASNGGYLDATLGRSPTRPSIDAAFR